jgi:thymidylate kinase
MQKRIGVSTTALLTSFFVFLEKQGVRYCVLGDTNELPEDISSDVDIVVSETDISNINDWLIAFAETNCCKLVQVIKHEPYASCYVLAVTDEQGKPQYLNLDICSNYSDNGKLLLRGEELLKGIVRAADYTGTEKPFYVASPDVEFQYYLLKKAVKGEVNKEQFTHLLAQFKLATGNCVAELEKFWLTETCTNIRKAFEEEDFEQIKKTIPELKQELIESRIVSLNERLNESLRLLGRIKRPTGAIVAFMGPDGAGKTAIGERLIEELYPAFRGLKQYHLRPHLLGTNSNHQQVIDPHGKPPRSALTSIAKLLYFLCDYYFGFVLRIFPSKTKSHLVIFDRYFHDLTIDPKRYRYGAPLWLAKSIAKLVPKPDVFVVLDAPPEVIQSRKQEVSEVETHRQRLAYLDFASKNGRCIVLDTSLDINLTVTDGTEKLLNFLNKRQLERLSCK